MKHRGSGPAQDEQFHVLPLYVLDATDEYGSRQGQVDKVRAGALQVLNQYPTQVRTRSAPYRPCKRNRTGLLLKKGLIKKLRLGKARILSISGTKKNVNAGNSRIGRGIFSKIGGMLKKEGKSFHLNGLSETGNLSLRDKVDDVLTPTNGRYNEVNKNAVVEEQVNGMGQRVDSFGLHGPQTNSIVEGSTHKLGDVPNIAVNLNQSKSPSLVQQQLKSEASSLSAGLPVTLNISGKNDSLQSSVSLAAETVEQSSLENTKLILSNSTTVSLSLPVTSYQGSITSAVSAISTSSFTCLSSQSISYTASSNPSSNNPMHSKICLPVPQNLVTAQEQKSPKFAAETSNITCKDKFDTDFMPSKPSIYTHCHLNNEAVTSMEKTTESHAECLPSYQESLCRLEVSESSFNSLPQGPPPPCFPTRPHSASGDQQYGASLKGQVHQVRTSVCSQILSRGVNSCPPSPLDRVPLRPSSTSSVPEAGLHLVNQLNKSYIQRFAQLDSHINDQSVVRADGLLTDPGRIMRPSSRLSEPGFGQPKQSHLDLQRSQSVGVDGKYSPQIKYSSQAFNQNGPQSGMNDLCGENYEGPVSSDQQELPEEEDFHSDICELDTDLDSSSSSLWSTPLVVPVDDSPRKHFGHHSRVEFLNGTGSQCSILAEGAIGCLSSAKKLNRINSCPSVIERSSSSTYPDLSQSSVIESGSLTPGKRVKVHKSEGFVVPTTTQGPSEPPYQVLDSSIVSVKTATNHEVFEDPAVGGVAIALCHGAVLFEVAKRELHATTALRNPNRYRPNRISLVFYQHKNLNLSQHGYREYQRKSAERRRLAEERRLLLAMREAEGMGQREEGEITPEMLAALQQRNLSFTSALMKMDRKKSPYGLHLSTELRNSGESRNMAQAGNVPTSSTFPKHMRRSYSDPFQTSDLHNLEHTYEQKNHIESGIGVKDEVGLAGSQVQKEFMSSQMENNGKECGYFIPRPVAGALESSLEPQTVQSKAQPVIDSWKSHGSLELGSSSHSQWTDSTPHHPLPVGDTWPQQEMEVEPASEEDLKRRMFESLSELDADNWLQDFPDSTEGGRV